MSAPEDPAAKAGQSSDTKRAGMSRRRFVQNLALLFAAAPLLHLGDAAARAEKRRRNHRGNSTEMWIGHC